MAKRTERRVIPGIDTGAGVRLRGTRCQSQPARLDPFLMLGAFSGANADDPVTGFPSQPQRGPETVTYLLDGPMGNRGDLRPGDAQWTIG